MKSKNIIIAMVAIGAITLCVAGVAVSGWLVEIGKNEELQRELESGNATIASLNSDLNITKKDLITLIDMFEMQETESSGYWRKGPFWITKEGNYTCVLQNVGEQTVQAGISSTNDGEIVIEVRKFNETSGTSVWKCTGEECLNATFSLSQ